MFEEGLNSEDDEQDNRRDLFKIEEIDPDRNKLYKDRDCVCGLF